MTKLLSPAAQKIKDAFGTYPLRADHISEDLILALAAALRAAADQIASVKNELIDDCWYEKENPVRDQLLAIATELENAQ